MVGTRTNEKKKLNMNLSFMDYFPRVPRATHHEGFPLIAQTIVRTCPIDIWTEGEISLARSSRIDRAMKAQLKFRCWDIKDIVMYMGTQGSLNSYLFNLGIAVVASEELGIPGVTVSHVTQAFQRGGCEHTISRNVSIVKKTLLDYERQK